jgi:ribosomal-protein-alanine N-acetyltransferase
MKIKRFEKSNLEDIVGIEGASFSDPWSQKMFLALHEINPKGFYVVKLEDRVVAYAIILIEPYIDKTSLKRRGHLINLAVSPDHRRQGIGSTLISRLQKDMKKNRANLILLEVRRTNKAALDFYSKLMFKRIGSIRGFYKDEDAMVMSKEI